MEKLKEVLNDSILILEKENKFITERNFHEINSEFVEKKTSLFNSLDELIKNFNKDLLTDDIKKEIYKFDDLLKKNAVLLESNLNIFKKISKERDKALKKINNTGTYNNSGKPKLSEETFSLVNKTL